MDKRFIIIAIHGKYAILDTESGYTIDTYDEEPIEECSKLNNGTKPDWTAEEILKREG